MASTKWVWGFYLVLSFWCVWLLIFLKNREIKLLGFFGVWKVVFEMTCWICYPYFLTWHNQLFIGKKRYIVFLQINLGIKQPKITWSLIFFLCTFGPLFKYLFYFLFFLIFYILISLKKKSMSIKKNWLNDFEMSALKTEHDDNNFFKILILLKRHWKC